MEETVMDFPNPTENGFQVKFEKKEETLAIGIDLGTTYSCVALYRHGAYGNVEIIQNEQGNRITPSCVAFTSTERLVGEGAFNQIIRNPLNTIFDAKRLIGRRFSDTDVQNDMKHWPFQVVSGMYDKPIIVVEHMGKKKQFLAEEISSMVISKMKETAEIYIGRSVEKVVVTVPAYFNDAQRRTTKDAGTIAGLTVMRIINEPTAAAIAYGLLLKEREVVGKKTVFVFDFGGGTFDVSLLKIDSGTVEVKATGGDTHLGGEDINNILVNHFVKEFKRKYGKDLDKDSRGFRRMRSACEKAKRNLSFSTLAVIDIDSVQDGVDFEGKLSRALFEDLCMHLFEKCIDHVSRCLIDAKIKKNKVDEVVLVGGSTRIPKVQQLLREFFDGKELCCSLHPDEAVACGAAIQAAMLCGSSSDECPILKDFVVKDVTPLSLGISYNKGVMSVIVPRHTPIPTMKIQSYTIASDYQTSVSVPVYEGERSMVCDNNFLGNFILDGITPAFIHVTFNINEDGLLNVTAMDESCGFQAGMTFTNDSNSSQEEIDKMVGDAVIYRNQDMEKKKKADAKSGLATYAYKIRNTIRNVDIGCKLMSSERKAVEVAVLDVLKWSDVTSSVTTEAHIFDMEKTKLENIWNPIKAKLGL
ncbi:70 kDa heat shock protein [Zostera marina]|uniref:70 kDa heat shock protein n=1 Tax=Zostera marina TaxID=29655 RepID=A0A0K9NS73_ZOSMR|nr:70 kDa heat shock protein [Zostera marina]